MSRINSKTISWNPSSSSDVQAYRVYYKPDDGTAIQYTDPYIETPDSQVLAPDDFPSDAFDVDGDYRIGVGALDDMGNESDIEEGVYPFDLTPPSPVTGLSVS